MYVCILSHVNYIVFTCIVITISPPGPIQGATVGSYQVIDCIVNSFSEVDITISWIGPGGGAIINDNRVSISPTTSGGNNYTSSVQFTYLMEGDEGTYTCNVMILETTISQLVEIQSLTSKLTATDNVILPFVFRNLRNIHYIILARVLNKGLI